MEVQTTTAPKTVEECCVCSAPVGIKGTGHKKTKIENIQHFKAT